jgi:outer membrane lipoprotein SlyB
MNQNRKTSALLAILLASSVLAGCASNGYPSGPQPYPQQGAYPQAGYPQQGGQQGYYSSYGVVESIQQVSTGNSGIGAGAVIGGVVGGLLGNQVGGGSGRAVATAAGVVGGAVVGNQVQQRNRDQSYAYQVNIRLDNGTYQSVTQDNVADLNVGNRVRVENGRAFRY